MPTTLMQITCPSCDTCYGVDMTTFPPEGRAVRCARCQQIWTAHAETATPVTQDVGHDHDHAAAASDIGTDTPAVESPPLADDNPPGWHAKADDWVPEAVVEGNGASQTSTSKPSLMAKIRALLPSSPKWFRRKGAVSTSPVLRISVRKNRSSTRLPAVIAGLGAVVAGLIIWRADVVRLLPQTAICFQAIGLPVNLRGIAFQDLKVRTEIADGAAVLVIEGALVGISKKPVEIPRLRFIVKDSKGSEIYAWNAVLEPAAIKSGDTIAFRSRLGSPPADARDIEVRFFNRRDLARGAV